MDLDDPFGDFGGRLHRGDKSVLGAPCERRGAPALPGAVQEAVSLARAHRSVAPGGALHRRLEGDQDLGGWSRVRGGAHVAK